MIQVTEQAKLELKRLLEAKVDWPGARLRLLERDRGKLGLGVDIEGQNDQAVEYQGIRLLVVESGLASRLHRVILDVDDKPGGAELVICEV